MVNNKKRILIVCREIKSLKEKFGYPYAQFIHEQVKELEKYGYDITFFLFKKHGLIGYLKHLPKLKNVIIKEKIQLIHAHGGHIGAICILQNLVPVVTTYHGSDIISIKIRLLSHLSILFSKKNIFVSQSIQKKTIPKSSVVIPCGVDTELFREINRIEARKYFDFGKEKTILFAGQFNRKVKNPYLAIEVAQRLNVRLVELKNYKREEVCFLLNAVDLLLLTSYSEGSPQIIKEAMACNCPIVSTDVGDVKQLINNVSQSYITNYDPNEIVNYSEKVLKCDNRSNGREVIKEKKIDLLSISKKLNLIYEQEISRSNR